MKMDELQKSAISIQVKTKDFVNTVVKSTSCDRGWLKLMVQVFFAILFFVMFILIMTSALVSPSTVAPISQERRCVATNCRVICSNVIIDLYENVIYSAINDADVNCEGTGISLFFYSPIFPNEESPLNWLSNIQAHVVELVITGGNLEYIQPDSFMTKFAKNLHTLTLENLKLRELEEGMLVGLSSLKELDIRDCTILEIHRNVLRATDETLKSLQIKSSGAWDPTNLVGSSELVHLTDVDFSFNDFGDIINRDSFRELQFCKTLSLESSKITSISMGAFDFLVRIEDIYLNNNFLTTIHPGMFDRIISFSGESVPKIDLQHNNWNCDCNLQYLKQLQSDDILMGDPVCHYPIIHRGRPFSSIPTFCSEINFRSNNDNSSFRPPVMPKDQCMEVEEAYGHIRSTVYMEGICNYTNDHEVVTYKCPEHDMEYLDLTELLDIYNISRFQNSMLSSIFLIHTSTTTVMEIKTTTLPGFDLIWFSTTRPKEIYCVNLMPNYLRLYNIDENSTYVFCPISQDSRRIKHEYCIAYIPSQFTETVIWKDIPRTYFRYIVYVIVSLSSTAVGASLVYVAILKNPTLLKRSKRVLVVKHKSVEALVLPPKVPLRNEECKIAYDPNDKFIPETHSNRLTRKFKYPYFIRNHSVRSGKSNAPSYVSAAQPTDSQLAEWRLRYHFDRNITITSNTADRNTISWIYSSDPIYYSLTAAEDNVDDVIITNANEQTE